MIFISQSPFKDTRHHFIKWKPLVPDTLNFESRDHESSCVHPSTTSMASKEERISQSCVCVYVYLCVRKSPWKPVPFVLMKREQQVDFLQACFLPFLDFKIQKVFLGSTPIILKIFPVKFYVYRKKSVLGRDQNHSQNLKLCSVCRQNFEKHSKEHGKCSNNSEILRI